MPPRATPKPTTRAVTGAGYHGFRSLAEHIWYQNYFARRTIVVERPISTPTRSTDPFFYTAFRARRGWVGALSRRRDCNATIVREFCASLIQVENFHYEAYVRDRVIPFTPAMIAAVLDVDEEPQYQCPFPLDATSPTPDEVATELTGQPTVWTDSRLQVSALTPGYRLLFLAVAGCILPTTYTAAVDFERARIIYAIGRGWRVSLPLLFFTSIVGPTTTSAQNARLKSGGLITAICLRAGVQPRAGDEIQTPRQPIGETSQARSLGQLSSKKKRAQEEAERAQEEVERLVEEAQPSHMEEDSDEEPETEQRTKHRQDQPFAWGAMQTSLDEIIRQQGQIIQQQGELVQTQTQLVGRVDRLSTTIEHMSAEQQHMREYLESIGYRYPLPDVEDWGTQFPSPPQP